MKLSKTVYAVLAFIVLLVLATYSAHGAEPPSYDGPRIALGHSALNSKVTVGEVSYELRSWEFAATQLGEGWTKRGEQQEVGIFSLSRVVRPSWFFLGGRNYYRIGTAWVKGSPLVGDTNYRLGIGLEYKLISFEYFHYSSAGIHRPNTGIDGVLFRLRF